MPYDAEIALRVGSVRPLYAEVTLPEGQVGQIQAGSVFSLYREDGAIEPGFSSIPVSGVEPGPESTLRVWYLLNTATLVPGEAYNGVFSIPFNGTDSASQTAIADIRIVVQSPIEIAATYNEANLSTSQLFQTRLLAADTQIENPVWSDAELVCFLMMGGQSPQIAAALALETLALDRAKLANALRIGAFGSGEKEAYLAIAERAKRLRSIAAVAPVVNSPARVFTTGREHGARRRGSMDGW